MSELEVDIVAADHEVWSGKAKLVVARTADGEIGVMPRHEPVLATLSHGDVRITTVTGERIVARAEGGFLSVENDRVAVVADEASLAQG